MGNLVAYVENLYNTKRWLFWVAAIILSPILILHFYDELMIKFEVNKANSDLDKTKKADAVLSQTEDSSKASAEQALKQAQAIQEQMDNAHSVSPDWNQKK